MQINFMGKIMGLKKNRSDKYTIGLCNTFKDSKLKVLFFELDAEHKEYYYKVKSVFVKDKLDFFVHKTGSGGYHFLSPTLLTAGRWHFIIQDLKKINPQCPQLTLRVKPNKYYNEDFYWYQIYEQMEFDNKDVNSLQMCNYFNRIWKTDFKGIIQTELNIVSYPLPFVNEIVR